MFFRNLINPYSVIFPFILCLFVLDIILKAMSIWKAAKKGQKGWFIVLLIINSLGILPIIYLVFFSENKKVI